MKSKDFKNKTTEELEAELKKIKKAYGALIGVLIVLFVATIYGLITTDNKSTFIALIAVGISCGAVLPTQVKSIKEIKTELESRNKSH